MELYDGPVYIVDDFYFAREEDALWFQSRRTVYPMYKGSQPTDDGNFFMTEEERNDIIKREPELQKFIRQCYGSKEFIQNIKRYCFWLVDSSPADIRKSKILYERLQKVKAFRLSSGSKETQKSADTPHLFQHIKQPDTNYLLIPSVSSEKRNYIPMGYVSPDIIVTNLAFSLPNATPYHFGILTSSVHMGWMRRYTGRLRSDYRYSNTIIYNNFIWPRSNPLQVKRIEATGQKILDVRAKYPDCSFADLYDELTMPKDLRDAHRENDAAVMEAYGFPEDLSEYDTVNMLSEMYQEIITSREEN